MLWVLLFLPLAVGALLFALPREDTHVARIVGAITAAITVVLTVVTRNDQVSIHWLSRPFDAAFHFGATDISLWIALLLTVCTFSAIVASRERDQRAFVGLLLMLESSMLVLFLTRDVLVFALAWDAMLIPVFLCLVHWSGHSQAAWRYFLYNFSGGVALLLATAAFGVITGSTDVIGQTGIHVAAAWAPWIFAGFAFAFLVKTPTWPLHTWMPQTYEHLPSPMVSVVAGVQSKAGLYGFIAIGLAFLPDTMKQFAPLFIVLSVASLLYGAFVSLTQNDVKRIVAYSSLSHLGLILLAIFSFNPIALQGAVLYIVAHGLFSAAVFLVLGYIEERGSSRLLERFGGMGRTHPRIAGALYMAALAMLGLPGLAGFAGEIVILTGSYQSGLVWPVILALIPIVLSAAYMLRLYQGLMHGPRDAGLPDRRDLTWVEGLAVAPLFVALALLGINPHALLMGVLK